MKFEASNYQHEILKKVSFPYGDFYFLDNVIVSEIYEGVIFDYEKAKPVIEAALHFYGEDAKIGYISNRINTYSIAPQDWLKFYSERYTISAMALVAYTPMGLTNILLEKIFIRSKVKRFSSLDYAVHWMQAQLAPQRVEAYAELLEEIA